MVLQLSETHRFPSETWVTTINKFGLDGIHIELLRVGNLIQVSVPILKTQFGSISEMGTLMELNTTMYNENNIHAEEEYCLVAKQLE